jgi:hypothetical protein
MSKFAVVTGSPFDGMVTFGPFDDRDDAVKYAENTFGSDTWWVVELQEPE